MYQKIIEIGVVPNHFTVGDYTTMFIIEQYAEVLRDMGKILLTINIQLAVSQYYCMLL